MSSRWNLRQIGMCCAVVATLFFSLIGSAHCEDVPPVRVMSFNLRYGTAKDGVNHWDNRKEMVVQTIQAFTPDLLGTQETLTFQRDFIAEHCPNLQPFGVAREDGKDKGEMAAIFYDRDRFELLDSGNFWLSETPDQAGSKGWDALLPRISSWVKLKDKRDTEALPIFFLNTHFDHVGRTARVESAKLMRKMVQELGRDHRVVVSGDFNSGIGSVVYKELLDGPEGGEPKGSSVILSDSYLATQSPHPDTFEGTTPGFDPNRVQGNRIDWIFASQQWEVRSARIDRTSMNGRTPSDHFPITAVLRTAPAKKTLRILSYNIHHARGLDGKLDIPRISKIIREVDPDFVALQEVDKNTKRSEGVDQAAEIARLNDMYFTYGKAIDFQDGEYGQALLSRYPLKNPEVLQLPNIKNADGSDREQRIAVIADSQLGEQTVRLIGTHLDHELNDLRVSQAETLLGVQTDHVDIAILAGDMNSVPESRPIEVLKQKWKEPTYSEPVLTSPAGRPRRQIDYVFLQTKQPMGHYRHYTVSTEASDHLPLVIVGERP